MLLVLHAHGAYSTNMNVPFFKQFKPDLLIRFAAAQLRGRIRWLSCFSSSS